MENNVPSYNTDAICMIMLLNCKSDAMHWALNQWALKPLNKIDKK